MIIENTTKNITLDDAKQIKMDILNLIKVIPDLKSNIQEYVLKDLMYKNPVIAGMIYALTIQTNSDYTIICENNREG